MARLARHAFTICLFFGGISSWATTSFASDPLDTSYGRVDGDISLVMGAGVTLAPRVPRPSADLRLRYIETLGIFWDYEEAFGISNDPTRVMSLGMELRPLFLGRWLQGYEFGVARPDLLLDSLGVELGAYFAQPDGRGFGARQGLQAALGVELPLMTRAKGIWIGLHGGARWSDAVFAGADVAGPADRSLFLSITLSWHVYFGAHVVDVGDVRIE